MKKLNLLILSLLVTSCNFAPRSHSPCMDLPACWRIESNESSTCANVRWWEELGDPILDALIVEALKNNKDLKTAMWRVCEYYARYRIASSELFPQIKSEGSAVKEKFPVASFIPPQFDPITPYYKYDFSLAYEVDFWGRVRNISRAAYDELLAEVENRRTVVLTLVSEVAGSYIRLRELDRELQIARATLRDREEYVYLAKKRFEGGLTSEIEVEMAISTMEEVRAAIAVIEAEIPIQENLLSVLLGESPTCVVRGKTIDQFDLPFQIPTGLPSELLVQRPDIMAAERLLMAANAKIGAARAAFFPKLSLTGLFGGESFSLNSLFTTPSRAWLFGGEYLQQIFTGGRLTGELDASIATRQELLYQYDQTILNAFKEVNDALVSHKQALELVEIEKARVEAVAEYFKLAWLRYYEGQETYLTVLDAERQLFTAEIDLVKAKGDVFLTLVDIYKSLGGGWVIDADNCIVMKN